jgi:Ni/Co efflux regulator RcnB
MMNCRPISMTKPTPAWATVVSLESTLLANVEPVQRYQAQRYQAQEYRSFRKGDRFDSRYARNYQVIGNPYAYGLRAAPRGEHWVRSGNEALLVGLVGGVIGAVVANAF